MDRLDKKGKVVFITTLAMTLSECGKAQREWRGKEKCVDALFCMVLMNKLLEEGTPIEEVFNLMVRLYRIPPHEGPVTPEEAASGQRRTYNILSEGAVKTMSNAYKQVVEVAEIPGLLSAPPRR